MIHTELEDDVWIGDAPESAADVDALSQQGVKSILSLRAMSTEREFSSREIGIAATNAGLIYLNFALPSANFDDFHLNALQTKLDLLPRPVFVHAERWQRAAAACLINHFADSESTTAEVWKYAESCGIDVQDSELRAAVEEYATT
ncbi:hypothetical protein [Rubinisphaera sp. JC750]|uniref:hypothetical protein n=1 Tax=Rubinisphaera sp. JC750 TaxID=2898658 RepID=UPI001F436575|nr:hypothetical protein [Rubinisphaera sp. JC750]